MSKRVYLDSSVLLAAFRAQEPLAKKAFDVIDSPEVSLVVSDAVRLELLPKAVYYKNSQEVDFYQSIFQNAQNLEWSTDALKDAQKLAETYGLSAMDAIHIAHAKEAQVDEFVTAEKKTSPIFRVTSLTIKSIRDIEP